MVNVENRSKLPVEWWAPSISAVAMVAAAAIVAALSQAGGGVLWGFVIMAAVAAAAVFFLVSVISIFVVDVCIAQLRSGVVPTGLVAFLSALGASVLQLMAVWFFLASARGPNYVAIAFALFAAPAIFRGWNFPAKGR